MSVRHVKCCADRFLVRPWPGCPLLRKGGEPNRPKVGLLVRSLVRRTVFLFKSLRRAWFGRWFADQGGNPGSDRTNRVNIDFIGFFAIAEGLFSASAPGGR